MGRKGHLQEEGLSLLGVPWAQWEIFKIWDVVGAPSCSAIPESLCASAAGSAPAADEGRPWHASGSHLRC